MGDHRDLDAWDAEIEADFRRAVAETRANGKRKRGQRLIGAPIALLSEVHRLTKGHTPMIVALLIYRRTVITKDRTVTLPGAELAELGVVRETKRRALAQLEAAGLVQIGRETGQTTKVTLLWKGA